MADQETYRSRSLRPMHHTQDIEKKKKEYRSKTRQTIEQIPKIHLTIWCADANGQLGKPEHQSAEYQKIIGPYTQAKTIEQGGRGATWGHLPHHQRDTNEHMGKNTPNKGRETKDTRIKGS